MHVINHCLLVVDQIDFFLSPFTIRLNVEDNAMIHTETEVNFALP